MVEDETQVPDKLFIVVLMLLLLLPLLLLVLINHLYYSLPILLLLNKQLTKGIRVEKIILE